MNKISTKNTLAISLVIALTVSLFLSLMISKYFETVLMRYSLRSPATTTLKSLPIDNKTTDNTSTQSPEDIITKRNLFRAKLQIEIPKPKSEKEIEEELMLAAVQPLSLKGVWIGKSNDDKYAIIDKGANKGVWSYGLGEIVERGLAVAEITQNSVTLKKNDYAFTLRLFAKGYERQSSGTSQPVTSSQQGSKSTLSAPSQPSPAQSSAELAKGIKKEGRNVVIPKKLAEKIKADNSIVLTTIAVKGNIDKDGKFNGYKIVSVDKGSIIDKIGIQPNDIIQEVNGYKLTSQEEAQRAYNELKNSTSFEVKVIRKNRPTTLYYQIR